MTLGAAVSASASTVVRQKPAAASATVTCENVFFVGARGSGETTGLGQEVTEMVSLAQGHISGYTSAADAVNYPAVSADVLAPTAAEVSAWEDAAGNPIGAALALYDYYENNVGTFLASISAGVTATVNLVNSLHQSCPSSDIVLAGYSQGAMVIHQALLQLSGSVTTDIKGVLLLADGNRVPNTKAHEFGTSLAQAEGIETWINSTTGLGTTYPDIPSYALANTANICNAGDIVCDFNFAHAINYSNGIKVHESYAIKNSNGTWTYDPALISGANWVGTNLASTLAAG